MVKRFGSKTRSVPLWCYGYNDASAGQQRYTGVVKPYPLPGVVALSSHYRFFTNLYSRMGVLGDIHVLK
jgi:hypothetical protein